MTHTSLRPQDKPKPTPRLVFQACSWCAGAGRAIIDGRACLCAVCHGHGGWWVCYNNAEQSDDE